MTADDYARMLYSLLPPGKVWRVIGSTLYQLLLGCADELVRLHGRVHDLLDESDPTTAVELLPEYEAEFALTAAATTAERQANVTAATVRTQSYRPVDFQTALALLLAQLAAEVDVIERTLAFVASVGDQREIFAFFVYRDPALSGTYFLASAQAVISAMRPAHTVGYAIESLALACDDAHSLCDRDLIGGAAPAFVSVAASAASSSTTLVLNAPAGALAGDAVLMLAYAAVDAAQSIVTSPLPSGWRLLSKIATAAGRAAYLCLRVATSSEPSTHTFQLSHSGGNVFGICIAYRNVSIGAASRAGAVDAASASYVSPSLNLARPADIYVGIAWADSGAITSTAPASTTERANSNAAGRHVELFDVRPLSSGPSGAKSSAFSFAAGGIAAGYVLHAQLMAGG